MVKIEAQGMGKTLLQFHGWLKAIAKGSKTQIGLLLYSTCPASMHFTVVSFFSFFLFGKKHFTVVEIETWRMAKLCFSFMGA